jgi:hypothetical protein
VFWVISIYFNIRNTLPKSGTFLLGHPVFSSLNKFHITKPNRRKFNACDLFKVHNSWVTGDHFDFTHPAPRNLTALLWEGVCTQTNMILYSTHVRTNTLRETMYDHTYHSGRYACAYRQTASTYAHVYVRRARESMNGRTDRFRESMCI